MRSAAHTARHLIRLTHDFSSPRLTADVVDKLLSSITTPFRRWLAGVCDEVGLIAERTTVLTFFVGDDFGLRYAPSPTALAVHRIHKKPSLGTARRRFFRGPDFDAVSFFEVRSASEPFFCGVEFHWLFHFRGPRTQSFIN